MACVAEEAMSSAPPATACEALTEQYLDSLYRLFKCHDLAHLLGVALDRRGLLPQGDRRERFVGEVNGAMYRHEISEYELSRICAAFEEAHIPYLPLKGAVIRHLYAQPWMRTSCDLDVLVHGEDLERATDVLVDKYGYTTDRVRHYHNVSLFSESGVHLELHFNIFEATPKLDAQLARVWEYATPVDGSYRYELSNEFTMFYLIAHTARHFSEGGCGIKPLLDLYILQHKLPYDETAFHTLVKACNLETFYDTLLQLQGVWFADGTHTDLTRTCEDFLLNGGTYGTKRQKHATSKEKHTNMVQYFLKRVFPSFEKMQTMYPELRSKKWMYPVIQLRRMSHLFRPNAIQNRVEELKIVNNISEDKRDTVVNMMNELGL